MFDTHTNLMWYPDHLSDEFVEFALEAKRAKMRLSEDVYFAGADTPEKNAFDSTPEQLLEATAAMDRVIVFGIKAPFCGINADQNLIADFVKQHSDRFIGWCSVDPNDSDCVAQLEHYVNDLGLRGLKCSPIYQNWDPQDPRHLPLFKKAAALGIPVNIHQGTSFVRPGPLKFANPILLEDIAVACPDLRLVISHMGRTLPCFFIRWSLQRKLGHSLGSVLVSVTIDNPFSFVPDPIVNSCEHLVWKDLD